MINRIKDYLECREPRKEKKKLRMEDSKKRFTNRVQDYKKYSPSYPYEALQYVKEKRNIDKSWTIADIGSGTLPIYNILILIGRKEHLFHTSSWCIKQLKNK